MSGTSVIMAAVSLFSGGDSPQWSGFRGNNGTGVSSAEELPDTLDPELNLIWRSEILPGYSSPCIAGKDLFLTGSTGTKLVTLCLDAYSGEVRWQKEVDFDGKRPGQNSPAAPTPAADGEHVFVLFHSVGLIAYDESGKELWKKPLGPFNIPHGMASSPVLHGDLVILQVDQDVLQSTVSRALATLPVRDLTVENPPLEEVMGELFARSRAEVSAPEGAP